MVKSFQQLSLRLDSDSQILRDGIGRSGDALEVFGFSADAEPFNLPGCVKYVADITQANSQAVGTPVRDECPEVLGSLVHHQTNYNEFSQDAQEFFEVSESGPDSGFSQKSWGESQPKKKRKFQNQNVKKKLSFGSEGHQSGFGTDFEQHGYETQDASTGSSRFFGTGSVPKSRNGAFVPGKPNPRFLLPSPSVQRTATGGPGMLGGPRLPGGTGVAGGLRPQGGQFAPGGSRGFVGLRAPGAQRQANPRHPAAQPVHNMLHGAQQYHGGQRLPCPVQPAKLGLPVGQGPQQFPGSQGQERQARGPSLPRADNTGLAAKSQIPVWDNFPNGFITKN